MSNLITKFQDLSLFSCGSSSLVELEFRELVSVEGIKNRESGEKHLVQGENQQQTTHGTDPEPNPGHIIWWEASDLTTVSSLLP